MTDFSPTALAPPRPAGEAIGRRGPQPPAAAAIQPTLPCRVPAAVAAAAAAAAAAAPARPAANRSSSCCCRSVGASLGGSGPPERWGSLDPRDTRWCMRWWLQLQRASHASMHDAMELLAGAAFRFPQMLI